MNDNMNMDNIIARSTGADPGFQVRGGGGGALKENAPSGGRRENFWGISCEKSRFYAKKSDLFQWRREARKCLGYFAWKITILRQTIIFFPILGGGGGAGCAPPPPPGSAPGQWMLVVNWLIARQVESVEKDHYTLNKKDHNWYF